MLTVKSFAQDPRLFDNTWYLHNIIVDGNNNIPPSNTEIENVTANFTNPNGFESSVCDTLEGLLSFVSSEFIVDIWGMTLGGCAQLVNTDFQALYLEMFFVAHIDDVFTYTVVEEGNGSTTLTITNILGNQAIYSSQVLSTQEFSENVFYVYPNPASEKVFLQLTLAVVVKEIRLFDLQGRLIRRESSLKSSMIEIETSSLHSGLYFVQVIDDNGSASIARFVKE